MAAADDDADDKDQQSGVRSVETAARVLAAFIGAPGALPLKAVAAAAGMSGGKAHRYLVSLCRAGLVEQNPETQRYDLGGLALRVGLAALQRLDIVRLAATTLEDLRDRLNETVVLAVWGDNGPTVVRWEEASRAVTVNVRLGENLPLLISATGRAFLCWMPEHRIAAFVERERHALGLDAAAVAVLRAQGREVGLAIVDGQLLPGVAAVAAPVFDHRGDMIAAITALGHHGAFSTQPEGEPARAVLEAARGLTRRMGGRV
ncbi:IclR family transcriptional regulator [Novispirillum sp. DQ9]|uniref:IclR family transcriptional regulator n=1 Tax=Novispirillum sp. DQ9 TaxID=3398612 RepID=UPI003C7B61CD